MRQRQSDAVDLRRIGFSDDTKMMAVSRSHRRARLWFGPLRGITHRHVRFTASIAATLYTTQLQASNTAAALRLRCAKIKTR
jgi:hypothetical protein